jgi:predicted nucleic acid-binding protein
LNWHSNYSPEDFFLSVITTGEIRKGIEESRHRDAPKALVFERWLGALELEFEDRILSVTPEIADLWGRLLVRSKIMPLDVLIAATAAHHGYTVVTRNESDFQKTGVDFINPFRA